MPLPSTAFERPDEAFHRWLAALEHRHLAQLRFSEVSRALRALSSTYVERRHRLARGAALSGGGKRAAFALWYGPMHFLTVREVLTRLPAAPHLDTIVDLGCGTGAAGAAWALALERRPAVVGIDKHQWAVAEAQWTYRGLGLRGRVRQGDVLREPLPIRRTGIVAGWLANELPDDRRHQLGIRLLDARERGASILVLEPIARGVTPWWEAWVQPFLLVGGRADEWRIEVDVPEAVRKVGRAAGLSLGPVTARSLWVSGGSEKERADLNRFD